MSSNFHFYITSVKCILVILEAKFFCWEYFTSGYHLITNYQPEWIEGMCSRHLSQDHTSCFLCALKGLRLNEPKGKHPGHKVTAVKHHYYNTGDSNIPVTKNIYTLFTTFTITSICYF